MEKISNVLVTKTKDMLPNWANDYCGAQKLKLFCVDYAVAFYALRDL